ncbi:MAG: hypothetical protein NW223_16610 [Hyphomicrobiaceae bacterium]|nr:hypothetical protein [Hyphomicrobiaceae bacterium]
MAVVDIFVGPDLVQKTKKPRISAASTIRRARPSSQPLNAGTARASRHGGPVDVWPIQHAQLMWRELQSVNGNAIGHAVTSIVPCTLTMQQVIAATIKALGRRAPREL